MTNKKRLHSIACILLSLLLLFFLAASVRRAPSSEEREQVFSSSASDLLDGGAALTDAISERVENGLLLRKKGDAPAFSYAAAGKADTLRVTVAEPLTTLTLTYAAPATGLAFGTVHPVLTETEENGDTTYVFLLLTENDADTYTLAFGEQCTLRAVTHERLTDPSTGYRIVLLPLLLFLLSVGVLLLTERKMHFFGTLRDAGGALLACLRALPARRRVLYALSLAAILLYFLAAYLDLALSLTLPFFSHLLFALAILALAGAVTLGAFPERRLSFVRTFFLCVLITGSALALILPPTLGLSWDDEFHFMHMAGPASFLHFKEMPFSAQYISTTVGNFSHFFADTESFASYLLRMEQYAAPLTASVALPDVHPILLILASPVILIYVAYRYVVYLPGILVCLFGFFTGADTLFLLSAARIAYLLFYATVFSLAVRRLKYGRHLFAVTALLPTALYLAVNFSCDTFIFSLTALGFAYFIGELQRKDEPLSTKNAVIMLGAVALAAAPKPIYFILLAPMLFLPKEKLGSKQRTLRFRAAVLLLMLLVALTFVLPFLINTDTYTDVRGGADVSASGQIKYILSQPFAYAKTLFRFLAGWFSFGESAPYTVFYAYVYRGSSFLGTLYLALLLFVTVADRTREKTTDLSVESRYRVTSLLTLFLAVCLIVTSLYVGFTPVGADFVNGCQFRYVFPLLPLLLYVLGSIRLRAFTDEGKMTLLSLGGGGALNLILFFKAILERFTV